MKGFSLLELLICLSLVALSMRLTMPFFQAGYQHVSMITLTGEVQREIYLARREAINTHQVVSYTADDWDQKRIIIDASGKVRYVFGKLPPQYHLTFRNSLQLKTLTFTAMGFTNAQRGSFYLCGPNGTVRMIVSLSGRIRVTTPPP